MRTLMGWMKTKPLQCKIKTTVECVYEMCGAIANANSKCTKPNYNEFIFIFVSIFNAIWQFGNLAIWQLIHIFLSLFNRLMGICWTFRHSDHLN
jgi:hypothetical protein